MWYVKFMLDEWIFVRRFQGTFSHTTQFAYNSLLCILESFKSTRWCGGGLIQFFKSPTHYLIMKYNPLLHSFALQTANWTCIGNEITKSRSSSSPKCGSSEMDAVCFVSTSSWSGRGLCHIRTEQLQYNMQGTTETREPQREWFTDLVWMQRWHTQSTTP